MSRAARQVVKDFRTMVISLAGAVSQLTATVSTLHSRGKSRSQSRPRLASRKGRPDTCTRGPQSSRQFVGVTVNSELKRLNVPSGTISTYKTRLAG